MVNEIKLVIDSIFEELVRLRLVTDGKRTTINVTLEAINTIFEMEQLKEGQSYKITFDNDADFNTLWSGKISKSFDPEGLIKIIDTTKEDLDRLRKLQRRLGLKR